MAKRTPEEIEAIFARYFNRTRRGVKKKRATPRRGPIGITPEEWRNINYRRWVSSRPCCVPGCCISIMMSGQYFAKIDPAHTEHGGMSQKGPDKSCAPVCRWHHNQYDGKTKLPNGKVGEKAFESYYEVDMKAVAAIYWRMFQDR